MYNDKNIRKSFRRWCRVEMSDEALYAQYLKRGDNEALRCLLERHREGLTLFLFGYVRNAEEAEELMLDAFAEIAVGPTVFSGKSSFGLPDFCGRCLHGW